MLSIILYQLFHMGLTYSMSLTQQIQIQYKKCNIAAFIVQFWVILQFKKKV